MNEMISNKSFQGESEIFDAVRHLIDLTKAIFPKADNDELKLIINAAINELIEENKIC